MTTKSAHEAHELIDVRRAAAVVGRHPETIRRWIWSGRLPAIRRGRRLLVAASEVRRLGRSVGPLGSLAEWLELRRSSELLLASAGSGQGAADLVIEDRRRRETEGSSARR